MKFISLITVTFGILVFNSGNNLVYGDDSETLSPVCSVVEKLLIERKINTVLVARVSSKKEKFEVDIDNDGQTETITFMPTRTYGALTDITDEKRITIPNGETSATYSGAKVIRVNEKNYVLHSYNTGNSNLMELYTPKPHNHNYDFKILCNFESR